MLKKLLASFAVLGAAASVAGLGTFATFTSSASVNQAAINTGSVAIAVGAAGPANRLTLGASGVVPGDTMQRVLDLSNTGVGGSDSLASVALTTVATTSSNLDTDASKGLQMIIDSCSVPWTEAGSSPAYTYTCSGTTSTVLASMPVIVTNQTLSNLSSLAPATTDHLRVTLSLPVATDNPFQGKTSAITYTFTGNQRAGTNK